MTSKAIFLGTGSSMGIPVIGCECSVCRSSSHFNKRLRSSLFLVIEKKRYLIDVGPDFRLQALKHQIHSIDGVILTHSHFDHIGGLDELRIFYYREKKEVPCLVSSETLEEMKVRYHYIISPSSRDREYVTKFKFQVLEQDRGEVMFEGLKLKYFSYFQKGMKVTGIRYRDFAYVVDILEYSKDFFIALEGVETLVIDGTAWKRTLAHLGIDEIIELTRKIGCKKTYLTHIAHEIDHERGEKKLPERMKMAYDGLKLEL